ncbi:hypothetical protein Gotur_021399 [Gossypium turneri]
MIQQIQQESGIKIGKDDDLESLFSIDEESNEQSLCTIQSLEYSDSEFSSKDKFYNSSDGLELQIEQMEIKCYRAKEEKAKMIEELNLTSDISTDYESD